MTQIGRINGEGSASIKKRVMKFCWLAILHPFCAESGPFLSGKMSRFPGIRAAQKSKNCPGKKAPQRHVASLPLARSKVPAKGPPG
jgi:hypothetical protein